MARVKLAENATITDVARTLDRPLDYLVGVFGRMHAYKKQHGSAFVRIGITGRGIVPHYRIEPENDDLGFLDDYMTGGNIDRYFVAFHGRNHKQLDWGVQELKGPHWSRGYMGYDAVRELLGEMRGLAGKVALKFPT